MSPELYELLLEFIRRMRYKYNIPMKEDAKQNQICKSDETAIDSVSAIIRGEIKNDLDSIRMRYATA